MPKWGLTDRHRESMPWGLPKDVLKPSKTITDPVHGDIYINELERMIVDSAPLQRLRRVRQLGSTHLVYPGATHTRFSHTLGALRAAQDLLDAVLDQRYAPHPAEDLFMEWDKLPKPHERDKRVAEAIVLARIGALLHDMCHVPYGHSIEDDIRILEAHDKNVSRFETLWDQFDEKLKSLITNDLKLALRPLILSKEEPSTGLGLEGGPYAFVQDIVGNTICADLLDYLQRDHLYTGLPAKLGHRFIDGFYVTDSNCSRYQRRMVMRIRRSGRERSDVMSEVFKYLRYRYELSERALVHHAKLAADAMIGKLLEMWSDAIWLDLACKYDATLVASKNDVGKAKAELAAKNAAEVANLDKLVRERLEKEFLQHGDDGLIEHILDLVSSAQEKDSRLAAIKTLATRIQNRDLYKLIARCKRGSQAEDIYEDYGKKPGERRKLEEGAATYAGLKHRWHILLWIPSPEMRLKAAEVLVEGKGGKIVKLKDHDEEGGRRGFEIYESHRALWAISVFAPAEVKKNEFRMYAALSWLAKKMNIDWDESISSLTALAAKHIGSERSLARESEESLTDALDKELRASNRTAVALGSFDELINLGIEVLEKISVPDVTEDLLTVEEMAKVLSGYPKSLHSRDQKIVDDYVPIFIKQANLLTKNQRGLLKQKLSRMEPEGRRQMNAASTREQTFTIKSRLESLLENVRNKK